MGIDISCLGKAAQAQVKKELARRQKVRQAQSLKAKAASPLLPDAGSQLEQDYYAAHIWPKIQAGQIASCELHHRFETLPAAEYCGIRLPAAHYTPDFLITYANGQVEAIEVKSKMVRKLQREYIYRRRLFIEKIARPNGWIFTEYIQEVEKE